jgi:hypothetical protein
VKWLNEIIDHSRLLQQNRHLTDIGQRLDLRFARKRDVPDLA